MELQDPGAENQALKRTLYSELSLTYPGFLSFLATINLTFINVSYEVVIRMICVNSQGHSNLRILKRTDSRQVFLVFRTEEVSRMELKLAFK